MLLLWPWRLAAYPVPQLRSGRAGSARPSQVPGGKEGCDCLLSPAPACAVARVHTVHRTQPTTSWSRPSGWPGPHTQGPLPLPLVAALLV